MSIEGSPTTFPRFKDLPPELRSYVWQFLMPDPRPFILYTNCFNIINRPIVNLCEPVTYLAPVTLYVDSESSHLTKQWCRRHNPSISYDNNIEKMTLFRDHDVHQDILWIDELDLLGLIGVEARGKSNTDPFSGLRNMLLRSRQLAIPAASSLKQLPELATCLQRHAKLETVWLIWGPDGKTICKNSMRLWNRRNKGRHRVYRGPRYTVRSITSGEVIADHIESARLLQTCSTGDVGLDEFLSFLQVDPGQPRKAVEQFAQLHHDVGGSLSTYRWIFAEICDAGDFTAILSYPAMRSHGVQAV